MPGALQSLRARSGAPAPPPLRRPPLVRSPLPHVHNSAHVRSRPPQPSPSSFRFEPGPPPSPGPGPGTALLRQMSRSCIGQDAGTTPPVPPLTPPSPPRLKVMRSRHRGRGPGDWGGGGGWRRSVWNSAPPPPRPGPALSPLQTHSHRPRLRPPTYPERRRAAQQYDKKGYGTSEYVPDNTVRRRTDKAYPSADGAASARWRRGRYYVIKPNNQCNIPSMNAGGGGGGAGGGHAWRQTRGARRNLADDDDGGGGGGGGGELRRYPPKDELTGGQLAARRSHATHIHTHADRHTHADCLVRPR